MAVHSNSKMCSPSEAYAVARPFLSKKSIEILSPISVEMLNNLKACAADSLQGDGLHHFSLNEIFSRNSNVPRRNSSPISSVIAVLLTSVNAAFGYRSHTVKSSAVIVSQPNLSMYRPGSVTRPTCGHVILLTGNLVGAGSFIPLPLPPMRLFAIGLEFSHLVAMKGPQEGDIGHHSGPSRGPRH